MLVTWIANHLSHYLTIPSQERLSAGGYLSSNIKKEIDLIQTTSLDESLTWMRDNVVEMLQTQLAWETDIETALQQAGINVRISDECEDTIICSVYNKRYRSMIIMLNGLSELILFLNSPSSPYRAAKCTCDGGHHTGRGVAGTFS